MQQLLEFANPIKVSNGASAGTSEVDSSIVDMQGYDGIVFIADLGTVTDGSVVTLTPQQNTANSSSGMAAITGAATSGVTASTSSNKMLVTDTIRPSMRYVRAALTRTSQNAAVNTIIAIPYRARSVPVTADTSVLASKVAVAGS